MPGRNGQDSPVRKGSTDGRSGKAGYRPALNQGDRWSAAGGGNRKMLMNGIWERDRCGEWKKWQNLTDVCTSVTLEVKKDDSP